MLDSEVVFNLLVKVTDCCDRMNIPYFLGFYPMRIAITYEALPFGMRTTEIFVFEDHIPDLCEALSQENGLSIESLKTNPRFKDTCIKVSDRSSTYFDLLNPVETDTPAYSLLITPITSAPANNKKEIRAFMKAHYHLVIQNKIAGKPLLGFFKFFRIKHGAFSGRVTKDHVHLLRYEYRKYRFPRFYFSGNSRMDFNGHSFSTVCYAKSFLGLYYKKELEKYAFTFPIDVNRYIQQPEIPFVNADFSQPILIRMYAKITGAMNRLIKMNTKFINEQKRFFFRTVDRFALTDTYLPLKEACTSAHTLCDWDRLGELLQPYIAMVEKYENQKMAFAFDSDIYDYLIDYLYNTDETSETLKWLISERNNAFAYLNYVNSYGETMNKDINLQK